MDRTNYFDRLAAASRAEIPDHAADVQLGNLTREAGRDLGELISALGRLYGPEVARPIRDGFEIVADAYNEIDDRLRRVRGALTEQLTEQRLSFRDVQRVERLRHAAAIAQLMDRIDVLERILADAVEAEQARRARKPRPRSSAGWLGRARAYAERQGLDEGTANAGRVVNMIGTTDSAALSAALGTFGGAAGTTVTIMFAGELPAEMEPF